jgi:hypothetical protein
MDRLIELLKEFLSLRQQEISKDNASYIDVGIYSKIKFSVLEYYEIVFKTPH